MTYKDRDGKLVHMQKVVIKKEGSPRAQVRASQRQNNKDTGKTQGGRSVCLSKVKSDDKAEEEGKPTSTGQSGTYKTDKPTKDECSYCRKIGHWKNKCPLLLEDSKKAKENDTKAMTTTKDNYQEYGFCVTKEEIVASTNNNGLHDYVILHDNQASVGIFHNKKMLQNIDKIGESPLK